MDPDANLKEQRAIADRIRATLDAGGLIPFRQLADDAERLAELVQAMDDWISRGGLLPVARRQAKGGDSV